VRPLIAAASTPTLFQFLPLSHGPSDACRTPPSPQGTEPRDGEIEDESLTALEGTRRPEAPHRAARTRTAARHDRGTPLRSLDGAPPGSRGVEESSLSPTRLHEARDTAASFMIAAGLNIKETSTYMAHASVTITLDRYGHLFPSSGDDAIAKVDAYFSSVQRPTHLTHPCKRPSVSAPSRPAPSGRPLGDRSA